MGPQATLLPDGKRLHLHHGPIDLIIGADGDRTRAFAAAKRRFANILNQLVQELPMLRQEMRPDTPAPKGPVAHRMDRVTRPFCDTTYVTRMAAVAGSVADEVLAAMHAHAPLTRAFVNNGGDIALHLDPGSDFTLAMAGHDATDLGRLRITGTDTVRGIATSGKHGRSLSRGIADSVTVLAPTAAAADVAATLIANAVDLPGHPAILRRPADEVADDSDLGPRLVVVRCGPLTTAETRQALERGAEFAQRLLKRGLITAAALFLQDDSRTLQSRPHFEIQRIPDYA